MTQAILPRRQTRPLPQSPYKGLLAYTADDAEFFFGREVDRELIAAHLLAARLTVLYGPSGVGKTSVLDAGVAHDLGKLARETLEEEDTPRRVLVVFRTWRGDPAAGLAEAVAQSVRELLPDQVFDDPPPDATLTDVLGHWARELEGRLLIVLDQFEEYFVYASAGDRFDKEFPRAVNRSDLRANFVISIREDALAKLDRFKGRIPYLFDNYLRLDRLDLGSARLAIEGPLRRWADLGGDPVSIEDKLVEKVLEEVRPDLGFGQAGAGTAGAERPDRIETTFLQLVMTKLWETEHEAGSKVLRLSTLNSLGGAKGIVRAHLNEGLGLLSPDEKDVAAHIFQFVVTRSGQKVAHTAVDLADFSSIPLPAVTEVLERLSRRDAWILRRVDPALGEKDTGSLYEIYHDTLGEPILAWRSAHLQRMNERKANERARAARRRAKLWAIGAAAMLAVAAACLVLLFLALDAKKTARSQKLVAQSEAALDVDPARAVQLADDALGVKKTREAETAFRRAVSLSPLRVVIRHRGEVPRAEYTRDGKRVFALSADGTASISDAESGRRLRTIRHGNGLFAGDISLDGRRVMTAGANGTVRFWDTSTGTQLTSFHAPSLSGAWLDRGTGRQAVATSFDGTVRILRPGSRPLARRLSEKALLQAAFSPDGSRIVVSGADRVAWILDARTGRVLHMLKGHLASIDAVAWSPNGRLIATGGDDYQTYLWYAATGTVKWSSVANRGWGDPVRTIAFNAQGTAIGFAAGSRVYVVSTGGTQLAALPGHSDVVNDVEFRKQGHVLVTASNDGTARVWNYSYLSNKTLRVLLGDRSVVDTAVFSPDGRFVLTGSADDTARIWDVASGRELWRHTGWVLAAAISPDGKWILTGGRDFKLFLWNGRNGKFVGALAPQQGAVDSIRFSSDGRLVAIADAAGVVSIRRTGTWAAVATITRPVPVAGVAFSPNGTRIAVATLDGYTVIYDTQSGDPIRWLSQTKDPKGRDHPLGNSSGVAWSSDDRFIATTSSDARIHIWNPQGHLLHTFLGHAGPVVSPSFARGSDLLVTAGADHTARVWNAATEKPVVVLGDDPESLASAAFSPNGDLVATGDAGGLTQVWDWRRKQLVGTLPTHSDSVNSVSFTRNGDILSASNDGTAKVYRCGTCGPLKQLRDTVRRRERNIDRG